MKKRSLSLFSPPRTPTKTESPRKKPPKVLTLATARVLRDDISDLQVQQPWLNSVDKISPQATPLPVSLSPEPETLLYQPSPQLAEKWFEFIKGQNTPLLDKDDDGHSMDDAVDDDEYHWDQDPPPSYQSIVASTVVLCSPGKPKVIDIFPPASAKARSPLASPISSVPRNHSRCSSHFSDDGTPSHTRSSSVYSEESIYYQADTPASQTSQSSLVLSQLAESSKIGAVSTTIHEIPEDMASEQCLVTEPLLEPTSFLRDATPLGYY